LAVKVCGKCQVGKPLTEFNASARNGYQSYCRLCQASYDKTSSSPERIAKRTARRIQAKAAAQDWVIDYLRAHPCVDCGERDLVVLDFDHVYGPKLMDVSTMLRRSCSIATISTEVAKCEVRCANCHRRATARRNGAWWRSLV